MKKKILKTIFIFAVIASLLFSMGAKAPTTVYLGGFAAGFEVNVKGAYVIGLSDVITENGIFSPSKDAGIVCGDRIMAIGDTEINCAFDITKALKGYFGGAVVADVRRGDDRILKEITPRKDLSGRYKLGLFVRDALEGIGTVSFVTEDGTFMALGHPVCEDDGKACEIVGGKISLCSVYGVTKGERGKAGELKGIVIEDKFVGDITGNFKQGIKGKVKGDFDVLKLDKIQTGEGRIGKAEIITCIDGVKTDSFSVSVVKAEYSGKEDKNFVIKVTDKRLIDYSGGIVQGMSGSPIVQDGKLIGAVTHVFINDPTRGYGISIENMLCVAEDNALSNAA